MQILLKLSPQIEGGGTLPNTFYEAGSTNYQNQTSMPQKKKIIGQYPLEHKCKSPQQNISKLNLTIHLKNHIQTYFGDISGLVPDHFNKTKNPPWVGI